MSGNDRPGDTGGPGSAGVDVDVAVADRAGAELLSGTAQILAGLLALGLLEHAGSPRGLYEALFPDLPPGPARDRALFTAGAVTGAAAGFRKGRSRWDPADAAAVEEQLYEVGWECMARQVGAVARAVPAPRPEAQDDTPRPDGAAGAG